MRLISKLLIILMCFALTGCNYSEQNIENTQTDAAFQYKCSPVPLISAKQEQRQIEPEKKVLKYDNVKAIWLSYIDISPMLTGKTEQQFRSAFTQACKNISELGCNTIFVHIRPFGDALFGSELYPASRLITGQAGQSGIFDPLTIMTDIAHLYKLSIHGWINPLRLETQECFANYDDSFKTKQWFDSNNGYVCSVDGDKHLWLNPGYSEVRQFIANGAAEIVKKYDIDGIHYDDYFYPTTAESFDKACFASVGNGKTLSVWRLENITDMVKRIYDAVKSVNKDVVVGVSPQGNIDNNYRYMYADVKRWGSCKGYVDYICPQIYFGYNNPVKPFLPTLKEWENVVSEQSVALYVGLAVYKIEGGEDEFVNSKGIIAKQIADIGNSDRCKGFCLYAYCNTFGDSDRARKELDSTKRQISKIKDG